MASMDIFRNSAFSFTSLTGAIKRVPYVPQTLGALGIFKKMPVRTRTVFIDSTAEGIKLIPTSPIGAPPEELDLLSENARPFKTARLAKGFTLKAVEIEGIRAFGSETEFKQVQAEYLSRMARVRRDMELTHEFHRLGALQGKLLDADGTSVIYNYFTEFGISEPAAIDFNLDNVATNVRQICVDLARSMIQGSGGALTDNVQIHALAGNAFYDALVSHPNVEKTYLNWAAAAELRGNTGYGAAFGSFQYGGITWHNYRGTDEASAVSIPTDEAKFFPVGGEDVFTVALAPAEFFPYINTPGLETYAMNLPDTSGRNAFTRGELYSYPLYICQRPDLLRKGVRT